MNEPFKLKKCEECNGTGDAMIEKHYCDCPDCLGTGWEEPAKRIRNLEMKLAAVTKERDEIPNCIAALESQAREYRKVMLEIERKNETLKQQRDTMAEALRDIATFKHSDGQCDSGFTPRYVAFTALDTLKPSITDV